MEIHAETQINILNRIKLEKGLSNNRINLEKLEKDKKAKHI